MLLLPPPRGPSKFRTTVVKRSFPKKGLPLDDTTLDGVSSGPPIIKEPAQIRLMTDDAPSASNMAQDATSSVHVTIKGVLETALEKVPKSQKLLAFHLKEVNGLFERGVLEVADRKVAEGLRISGLRFVETVKHDRNSDAFEKARLVFQGFNNRPKILMHFPTVQLASQRLQFALKACDPSLTVILSNVEQDYTEAEDALHRPIFNQIL